MSALVQCFHVRFIVFDDVHALSATSTHFKWELMLYCLHCPTLNKLFLLLLLLLLLLSLSLSLSLSPSPSPSPSFLLLLSEQGQLSCSRNSHHDNNLTS